MKNSKLEQLAKKSYFPVRLRRQIVEKIYAGLFTEHKACEKYGISLKLIRQWRRSYYKHRILPPLNISSMKPKKNQAEETAELKAKLAALEKAYQDEKVKARAYEIMINIAEEQFQIPIRKKSGTQQPIK